MRKQGEKIGWLGGRRFFAAAAFLCLLYACAALQTFAAPARPVSPSSFGPREGSLPKIKKETVRQVNFNEALGHALARRGLGVAALCDANDHLARRILKEYGAVFLAGEEVLPPPVCMFTSAEQVARFQSSTRVATREIGGARIELQDAAMRSLLAARDEARASGLDVTPRDGSEAARRDYADTVRLWNSRFLPALEHWLGQGRLSVREAERLRGLGLREQVGAVLDCESRGLFFSKDFSKSILQSVAAPGASQHLSLLAFDANEYGDERVCRILARHGWFRTVLNDAPHFTYLGLREKELSARGLRKVLTGAGEFWVPNLS